MLKTVGIIAEYNPFHKGHAHQISMARKMTGADRVIVVMSGSYVQRGEPSVIPPELRARAALMNGADLVIEMPAAYSLSSAESYASCGVHILNSLHIDSISFGVEADNDPDMITKAAEILSNEPEAYKTLLKNHLKAGISYPSARQSALEEYTRMNWDIISDPNSILALEYTKAIIRSGSTMNIFPVKRIGSSYNSDSLEGEFSSAGAIRKSILQGDSKWLQSIPDNAASLFTEHLKDHAPISCDDFSLLLHDRLLRSFEDELSDIADITPELAARIFKLRNEYRSFSQFCSIIKNKAYTYSRISRCLMHIILDIRRSDMLSLPGYARVLGFRKDFSSEFGKMCRESDITLITDVNHVCDLPGDSDPVLLRKDLYARDLYNSVLSSVSGTPFVNSRSTFLMKV